MKTTRRHFVILVLLLILFAAPGLSAYFLYAHSQWLKGATTNKGTLLNPPVLLTQLSQHAKWHLLYWSPVACEADCLVQLDKLVRTRLALGRRLYDVDIALVLADKVAPLSDALRTTLQKQDVSVVVLSSSESIRLSGLHAAPELFISNPEHYLVLAYAETAPPDDLFHDIKRLLTKGN